MPATMTTPDPRTSEEREAYLKLKATTEKNDQEWRNARARELWVTHRYRRSPVLRYLRIIRDSFSGL